VATTVTASGGSGDANEKTNDNEYWRYGTRRGTVALNVVAGGRLGDANNKRNEKTPVRASKGE